MTKQAIIYARTASQDLDESKIMSQIRACKTLAKNSRRLTVIDIVSDEEISGTNKSQDRLTNLLRHCSEKEVRALIVYNTERLSRNFDDYMKFKCLLETEDIELVTVAPCLNDVKEVCNKYYQALRSANIKRGIIETKKRKSLTNYL